MRVIVIGTLGLLLVVVFALQSPNGNARENELMPDQTQTSPGKHTPQYSKSGYDVTRLGEDRIEQLAKGLTPEERHILLQKGTECAFSGALVGHKKDGLYGCRLCRLPLFGSEAKFKSGTGWPSFFRPFDAQHIHQESDSALGISYAIALNYHESRAGQPSFGLRLPILIGRAKRQKAC